MCAIFRICGNESQQGLQIVEKPATPVSRIQVPLAKNMESRNPESKDCLGFPYFTWGKNGTKAKSPRCEKHVEVA